MRVLVIGGTGFLSSAIVSELLRAGHEITVFTRGQRPLTDSEQAAGVRTLVGDRKDYDGFVDRVAGLPFDAVVDCICYTPEDAQANVRAFAGRIQHLLVISTDFVYGPHRVLPANEDTPTHAMSQYGRNKVACEELLFAAWREEQFPATALRPPHIMGAGGQLGSGSWHGRDPMLLDRLQGGHPVVLLDGGALLIQPVVHRDIGKACVAALGKPATFGQAYNVMGPDCVTTREYYDIVAATLGVDAPAYLSIPSSAYVAAYPDRAPFAHHRMYSVEKLARDTGYRPATTLRHAIFEMIDWLQATGAAKPYVETEQDTAVVALCHAFEAELRKALS